MGLVLKNDTNFKKTGKIRLKVLESTDKWFGVTYLEDRPDAVSNIRKLVDAGVYPEKLWT